ncbi:TonB-dependent Iron(III) dicitrate receptor [Helicobacter mustelae]|uniref:TonB-dependent receptor family protein n=1 Tax=Helicobacter mustelae TaxID=217 RepID=UPI000DFECE67|nr:TonB-dependent receptor [Helicobacter mustelae]STP12447.1 TonB-dependent Iron(III) dicitrate receptor [Helicobacter mustelae]
MKKIFYLVPCACFLFAENTQTEKTQHALKNLKLEHILTQEKAITQGTSFQSEDVFNNAGSRSVVSSKQLKESGYNTVEQALQNVPGVQIRDTSGTGILPKIELRGFGGAGNGHSNTGMLLLDGNTVYGGPYSNVELAIFPITFQMVDHIDIIKGGASVQYGPNTFSGVINFISKEIPKKWTNQIAQRTIFWSKDTGEPYNSKAGLANNILYDTFLRSGGMIGEHFGIQAQVNIIGGQSFREDSNTKIENYKLDAIYKVNPNHIFKGFYQYYYYHAKSPGSLSTKDYYANRLQNLHPRDFNSGVAKRMGVNYNWFFGSKEEFEGSFNLNYYFHDMTRNFALDSDFNKLTNGVPLYGKILRENIRRYVVNMLEPKVNFNIITKGLKQQIVFGMRYTSETIFYNIYRNGKADPKNGKDTNYYNNYWAFYISDNFKFFGDTLSINPGLRYVFLNPRYVNFKNTKNLGIINKTSNQFNPALSISYKPIKNINIYANYQRSFLPPQLGDMMGTNFDVTQTFQSTEAGIRYLFSKYGSINVNYFAIFADNYRIGRFAQGQYGISAISQGVEVELYLTPVRDLQFHFAYSFTDARVSSHSKHGDIDIYGKFLPYISPQHFSFDVIYAIPKFATLGASGYYYSKSYSDILNTLKENLAGTAGQLPDYFVFNVQISRTLWKQGNRSIEGSISANNLFNAKYYFRGIGTSPIGRQPAPGRSITVYVSYKF